MVALTIGGRCVDALLRFRSAFIDRRNRARSGCFCRGERAGDLVGSKFQLRKCALARGKCALARGECAVADGKCALADGKCGLARGKCGLADGKCALAHGKCALAHGKCALAAALLRSLGADAPLDDERPRQGRG